MRDFEIVIGEINALASVIAIVIYRATHALDLEALRVIRKAVKVAVDAITDEVLEMTIKKE